MCPMLDPDDLRRPGCRGGRGEMREPVDTYMNYLVPMVVEQRLPPITEPLRKTLPNGIVVIIEHYRDNTARLILPQFSNRCYWLATRKGKPSDLYLKDHHRQQSPQFVL